MLTHSEAVLLMKKWAPDDCSWEEEFNATIYGLMTDQIKGTGPAEIPRVMFDVLVDEYLLDVDDFEEDLEEFVDFYEAEEGGRDGGSRDS